MNQSQSQDSCKSHLRRMMTIMGDRCVKYKNAFNKPLPIVITLPSDLIPHVRSINGDYRNTDESKLRRQKILKSKMGSFINANDVAPSSSTVSSAITAGLSTGVDNRGEFARRNARSDYDRYSAPENLVLRDLKLITEGNNEERSDLIALKSKRPESIISNISTTGTNTGTSTGGDTTEGSRGRGVFKKRKTTNNKTLFPDITSRIVVASNSEPCFSAGTTSRSDFNKDKVHLPLSYHNDVDDDSDNDNGV